MPTSKLPGFALTCALAGALALVAWPQQARACRPSYSVKEIWPAGGELPANAFAVVVGSYIGPDMFTVLVDDQPVEFIVSQQLSGKDSARIQIALRPLVPPPVGETWSVRFGNKPNVVGTFTVAAADNTPPAAPPASLHFDVHDFPLATCSSCGGEDVNYWPHLADGAEDGGAPLLQALYMGHPGADDDKLLAVRRVGPQTPFRVPLTWTWFAEGQPVTEAVCFTVRLLDLAGNEAASALRTCKPCHASIDPMQGGCEGVTVKDEPAWTDADLFPGGACAGESVPSLPPEFPDLDPDTSTGGTDTGDGTSTSTSTTSTTGDDPSPTTSGSSTSGPTPTSTTGDDPSPTTSGSSISGPTTTGPDAMTTTGEPGSEASDTAGETPDKVGCGCRGTESSPSILALLALMGLRRRSRRS